MVQLEAVLLSVTVVKSTGHCELNVIITIHAHYRIFQFKVTKILVELLLHALLPLYYRRLCNATTVLVVRNSNDPAVSIVNFESTRCISSYCLFFSRRYFLAAYTRRLCTSCLDCLTNFCGFPCSAQFVYLSVSSPKAWDCSWELYST